MNEQTALVSLKSGPYIAIRVVDAVGLIVTIDDQLGTMTMLDKNGHTYKLKIEREHPEYAAGLEVDTTPLPARCPSFP